MATSFRKELESMVWSGKHRDYKSKIDGVKYVTIYRKGQGTCIEPLASLSDDDLISILPGAAVQADFEKRKPRTHSTKASNSPPPTRKIHPRSPPPILRAPRVHSAKRDYDRDSSDGRTISEAAAAGDAFQVETMDGKHQLFMPGSRGVKETLRHVRRHWKHRLGQRVRIYRVLPGSRIGAMVLQEHSEATL